MELLSDGNVFSCVNHALPALNHESIYYTAVDGRDSVYGPTCALVFIINSRNPSLSRDDDAYHRTLMFADSEETARQIKHAMFSLSLTQ